MTTITSIVTKVQALLNDPMGQHYTFDVQKPYLNICLDELREVMEQNNVSMTNESVANILVTAGVTQLTLADLPNDLIEFRRISERTYGTSNQFIPMTRMEFIPGGMVPVTSLVIWAWEGQKLLFVGATSNVELKLDYTGNKLLNINEDIDTIPLINCASFMQYRTAALCAQFVGENPERAASLNQDALLAIDRFTSINIKPKQGIFTRRRGIFNRGFRGRY